MKFINFAPNGDSDNRKNISQAMTQTETLTATQEPTTLYIPECGVSDREAERLAILGEMRRLISIYLQSNHRRRVEPIERALHVAAVASRDRRRRNGAPHIFHPLAVARIVAQEMGLGSKSICAALLHDVLENPDYTVSELSDMFGPRVAGIVEGLQRISGGIMAAEGAVDAGRFRNLLLSMEGDVRVILVKMADRMHNMRHISELPSQKADKIARETLYVYAPLAHRLGLNSFKEEFEDLAFRHLHPDEYERIRRNVEQSHEERTRVVEAFLAPVRVELDKAGFVYTVKARVKSAWSIYNKMQTKGVAFADIYDIYATRIIFEPRPGRPEGEECMEIRRMIRGIYETAPERDRDWITAPKSNGYSALHLTALAAPSRWIEVQIRSRRMDEIAELGYAAHWKYKDHTDSREADPYEHGMEIIKEILDNPTPGGMDQLDSLRLNLLSPEIYVFTPRGDLVRLHKGATVLDLAYTLHTDVGDHCLGAKVNSRLCHPSHRLESGDKVEILTADSRLPEEGWLKWCILTRSRNAIRSRLRHGEEDGEEHRWEM